MPKMRVHEVAKLLDKSSKEIITELKQQGVEVQSHMSTVSDENVEKLKTKFQKKESGNNRGNNENRGNDNRGKRNDNRGDRNNNRNENRGDGRNNNRNNDNRGRRNENRGDGRNNNRNDNRGGRNNRNDNRGDGRNNNRNNDNHGNRNDNRNNNRNGNDRRNKPSMGDTPINAKDTRNGKESRHDINREHSRDNKENNRNDSRGGKNNRRNNRNNDFGNSRKQKNNKKQQTPVQPPKQEEPKEDVIKIYTNDISVEQIQDLNKIKPIPKEIGKLKFALERPEVLRKMSYEKVTKYTFSNQLDGVIFSYQKIEEVENPKYVVGTLAINEFRGIKTPQILIDSMEIE